MKIFITGITGTLGKEVCKILLQMGHNVTGLTRDELKLKTMMSEFGPIMALGDVRDLPTLIKFTKKADLIFHFAALKHIDLMEDRIEECIKTNLLACNNVYKTQEVNNIKRVVFSSTDKAVYPVNVYGMCKAISERIFLKNKNNVICRYGNVLASRGSVVHLFKDQIDKGIPISLTHPDMTRFWITIKDAAEFVVKKGLGEEAGLFIPKIKSYPVKDLAKLMYDNIIHFPDGTYKDMKTDIIGMRHGEKIHECLFTKDEFHFDKYSNRDKYSEAEMKELLERVL